MNIYRFRYATRYRWRYETAVAPTEDEAREIAGRKVGINPVFLGLVWVREGV